MSAGKMRLRDLPDETNDASATIFDAALEVHRTIGNRLSERTYRNCLSHELRLRGVQVEMERPIALRYKDLVVPDAYFADILVADRVVVELKCTRALDDADVAQVITYLHMSGCKLGMLFNFHASRLRDDFRRIVHDPSRVSA